MKKTNFYRLLMIFMTAALLVLSFAFLFLGRYSVPPKDVLSILWNNISGSAVESIENTVVWNVRFPRILLAALVGAGLSAAGASFQGCFQNPLVSPDVLGVSAGAGFGAALGILLTSGVTTVTTTLAFTLGVTSVLLSWLFSRIQRTGGVLSLVLSGMVVSSVFQALISLIKLVADTDSQLPAITFWLMGSFSNTTFNQLRLVATCIVLGTGILLGMRWHINLLTLGDSEARGLGINPVRIRLIVIAAATMISAAAVMAAGIIGWVGLIMPNVCRMVVGADYRRLLPASCLAGAIFMISVDFVSRYLTAAEIPIGILTAIIGAPFFFIVLQRTRQD